MKNTISAIPMTSFDATVLQPAVWQQINPLGLPQPCTMISIVNDSATNVEISYDGITAHHYIQNDREMTLNLQTNSLPTNYVSVLKAGTIVYVRGIPAVNPSRVYLIGYY